MHKAFVPGAGLGTRMLPLTRYFPKPLLPLFHRPLASHAIDHCRAAGFCKFAINTHHLAGCWENAFPPADANPFRGVNGTPAWQARHAACPVAFFHEPVLLDTGGGVRNIAEWIGRDSFLVYNGDIFTNLSLTDLIGAHEDSGLPVTLALRSHGSALHVAVDRAATRVTDIRQRLGRAAGTHQFTGIYCATPDLLELLPPNQAVSVIPAFLELAAAGRLGCVVIDDGVWSDLGEPATYLTTHLRPPLAPGLPRIHPDATVAPAAAIDDLTWISPGAVVPADASLTRCVVLPGVAVPPGGYHDAILLPDGESLAVR